MKNAHDTTLTKLRDSPDLATRSLYELTKTAVNVADFWKGELTFQDVLWQCYLAGRVHKDDELHQVICVVDTEPRGCKNVVAVTGFYVIWLQKQDDSSIWVTFEPKTSFLPSGVHVVSKYYSTIGITYQNSWLVLNAPGDLHDDVGTFTRRDVDELVSSVGRRSDAATLDNAAVRELLSDTAFEGELLSDEGEPDFDDFEHDCDDRPDTTNLEMLADLRVILQAILDQKKGLVSKRCNWTPAIEKLKTKFNKKYACLNKSKDPFKHFRAKCKAELGFA